MPPVTRISDDGIAMAAPHSSGADLTYASVEYSSSSSAEGTDNIYSQQQPRLFLNGSSSVLPSLPTPPSSTDDYLPCPPSQQYYLAGEEKVPRRRDNPLKNLFSFLQPDMPENTVVAAYCALWYACSAMTSNSGKQILDVFPFPVTLTFVQFGLVGLQCYATAALSNKTRIRSLNTQFIISMVPLSLFLVGGHVFTSVAMSRIPVSLVHTVKALSPLFTVFIYRFLFQAKYTSRVYVSLLPLITGVVLTCTFTLSTNWIGIVCAFLSCLVFVAQNIYNKKVLFEGDHKLPRLQILCYLSSMAFFAMLPLWIYTDGAKLVAPETDTPLPVWLFVLNGITNFGQSYFAFATLEKTSPVTYSIASLIKRIVVIVVSILWFGQEVSFAQAVGIFLTFVGLWMYQNAKSDVDRGEARAREKSLEILPTANRVPVEHRHRFPMLHGQWRLWNNTTVRNEKTK